jgi:aryl-alcohol dehydrogenase-like predicted oxidoreductase
MKLALGTVQFGLDYGVSNTSGQVKFPEVKNILEEAKKYNIDTLDTAIVYGNSESILGKIGVDKFNVVTKLPSIPKDTSDIDLWVNNQVKSSLKKMRIDSVSALLLHKSSDLFETSKMQLFDSLCKLKDDGVVDKVGVSIYHPDELDALERHGIKIDIVQAPFNILDRRLETTGWLDKLNQEGVELHSRSVFMQGLLLQEKDQRDLYFNKWNYYFKKFDEWVNDTKQTPLDAALNFSYSNAAISKVIVGVQSKIQLIEIIKSISQHSKFSVPDELKIDDPMLINPTNWKL